MIVRPTLYIDSCCFIDLVKSLLDRPLVSLPSKERNRADDCWFLRRLCDASRDGVIRLVTSTLSVAECLHVGDSGPPDQRTRDLFHDFLTSGSVVELLEADVFVAEEARRLYWDRDVRVKGADGLHLATAMIHDCREFLTTDDRIRDQSRKFGQAVPKLRTIGINVVRASETRYLPDNYRTPDMFGP